MKTLELRPQKMPNCNASLRNSARRCKLRGNCNDKRRNPKRWRRSSYSSEVSNENPKSVTIIPLTVFIIQNGKMVAVISQPTTISILHWKVLRLPTKSKRLVARWKRARSDKARMPSTAWVEGKEIRSRTLLHHLLNWVATTR